MRKIIQIMPAPAGHREIVVLCDDGTVWSVDCAIDPRKWIYLTGPDEEGAAYPKEKE